MITLFVFNVLFLILQIIVLNLSGIAFKSSASASYYQHNFYSIETHFE